MEETGPCKSFSPETCIDLVDKLTDTQLLREAEILLDTNVLDVATKLRANKADAYKKRLKDHFRKFIGTNQITNVASVSKLTDTISRQIEYTHDILKTTSEDMGRLQKEIAATQEQLTSLISQPLRRKYPEPPEPRLRPTGTCFTDAGILSVVCPFEKSDSKPFEKYQLDQLDSSTIFDRDFHTRSCAYYGEFDYRYPGGHHRARPISDNEQLAAITEEVKRQFPDFRFNSAMITKYSSPSSSIPPHSDDEEAIAPDSTILTISLGGARDVLFRRKPPGRYERVKLRVEHGEVYTMSRASQDIWDHSVPKTSPQEFTGPRISVTYRLLKDTKIRRTSSQNDNGNTSARPDTSQHGAAPPRRVLILSDSRNMDFDCSLLKEPVVAFRRNLFYLRDIEQHRESIEQSDIVLISSGINDVRHHKASPKVIHDHLKSITSKFKAQFLFEAIAPISMNNDRFNLINDDRDRLNTLLLQLSLRQENFKLFDNLSFGLAHLARDGIHLTSAGKFAVSANWVECILRRLGFHRGPLPLRYNFMSIAEKFRNSFG